MSKRISELPGASALDGTEKVEITQGGDSARTTTQDIADLAAASSSLTFSNGINESAGTVKLGGSLTEDDTEITGSNSKNLSLGTSGSRIANLTLYVSEDFVFIGDGGCAIEATLLGFAIDHSIAVEIKATEFTDSSTTSKLKASDTAGVGRDHIIEAGDGNPVGNNNGGSTYIRPGQGTGSGIRGYVILDQLPTSASGLPTGALWNSSGTLKIA